MRHLRIARGDITRWPSVDAIVTSANAGLVGNKTPSYWRFRVPRAPHGGHAAPASALKASTAWPSTIATAVCTRRRGPSLQAALDAQPRHARLRQSLSASEPWRGSLLPSSSDGLVACLVGRSVVTPAFGALREQGVKFVVHAVAPDGRDPIESHGRPADATPLLRSAFASALAAAAAAGARSLAVPAIGCGVNNWTPPTAARAALAALDDAWKRDDAVPRVDFVLRSDDALEAWRQRARDLFGPPQREGAGDGDAWEWDSVELP